jgi:hypothetical protein
MSDASTEPYQNQQDSEPLQFGNEKIEVSKAGFSFHPIQGFELENNGTVYLYSESGNLEIYLVGGEIDEKQSITELNDDLTNEFMENVGDYDLFEAGKDLIQGVTGFLNKIRFTHAEEEGLGNCLICSPAINQFFFMLVIANAEYWQTEGPSLWKQLKSHIQFQSQSRPQMLEQANKGNPDLTIEIYEDIDPGDDFYLTIERGDLSLLLAARSYNIEDRVSILSIIAPDGEALYRFNPETGELSSTFCDQPIVGDHGEVCFFFPKTSHEKLQAGDYSFSFATDSGAGLQEIQFIIRSGHSREVQKFDLNFWLAIQKSPFFNPSTLDEFKKQIHHALTARLLPVNLSPGCIEFVHPAPDELESFATVNLNSDLTDCSYMIAESVTNDRALNIGLVDVFVQGDPPVRSDVWAISSGSPGMILSPGSSHACILIHWPRVENDTNTLAEAILQQLIIFSGIETKDTEHSKNDGHIILNNEIAWRLRRHPLFYDAA